MKCKFDFYTNIGGCENNEDAYLTAEHGDEYLFAVADGLGGHDCGEVASNSAVQTLKRLFDLPDFDPASAMQEANRIVFEEQQKTGKLMRTTLALAYVKNNNITIAHAGDTRVYLFHNGKLLTRTLDHSASQLAVRAGEITEDQIRNHEDRNVLTKVLGGYENLRPEIISVTSEGFDALLLCSDGFWEYVLDEEMAGCLRWSSKPSKWISKMCSIRKERAPDDCDNNTAVAVFLKN